jgi:hypothetical protein
MAKIINPQAVKYVKQLVKDIREDIKTQIPHTLPDITYEVVRVQKHASQVIQIRFDGTKMSSLKEMLELSKKIRELYGKYTNYTGYKSDDLYISIFHSIKGKFAETLDRADEYMKEYIKINSEIEP